MAAKGLLGTLLLTIALAALASQAAAQTLRPPIEGNAMRPPPPPADGLARPGKLTLTGEGNLETEPDMVRISVDLEAQERKDSQADDEIDLAAAASTATDLHLKASQGFLASLKELGIPDANITTTALTLSPITNWTNGQSETVGYEARSSLEIEMSASGKLEAAIIKASQDNLAEGVTVNVGAFRPYVSEERMLQLEQDLFDKAMADVTRKAEMFARGAQRTLGPVMRMSDSPMENEAPPVVLRPDNFAMQRAMFADAELGGAAPQAPEMDVPLGMHKLSKQIYLEYSLL
ncbi:DUF541 domain-containing protein [Chloropicon roscoffensis]|uniref:DUF541 domain-containing protein n=1 Tax=Chloropicon roscoffensis TaxID=1461544 RepID=A0AAX4PF16_9CHLO